MFIPLPECIVKSDKTNANYCLLFNKWVMFSGSFETPKKLEDDKVKEFIRLKDEYNNKKVQLQKTATTLKKRTMSILSCLRQKGFVAAIITCKVSDALICGIGDEHPLENSIRLDHCTGLPYIPSSSIKGVAKLAAEFNETTGKRSTDKEAVIFGSQENIGKVQFWDGFPVGIPALKIDIMNNHFPDYYSDKTSAPSDDMNPNPVPFIVVDAESEFYFPIVTTKEDLLHRAVDFLKSALSEWGVGAKTSVGYGIFKDAEIEPIPAIPSAHPGKNEMPLHEVILVDFKKAPNPGNFVKLIQSLTENDAEWLEKLDFFTIQGFNVGFSNNFFSIESIPTNIRIIIARKFLEKIDLKKAKKRAEKNDDKKDLERYEKLKMIIEDGH